MHEHEKPAPQELLAMKQELRERWEKLPPEHQASMVLTLVADVMQGEWGSWLHEALALKYPVPPPTLQQQEQTISTSSSVKDRYTAFGFTYTEDLYDTVGYQRLLDLLQAEETSVHRAEISTNNYGEFLFITASRPKGAEREVVGFWGLGFHERRDRYLLDEWQWYVSSLARREEQQVAKAEVLDMIRQRRQELAAAAKAHRQSTRGVFYEQLADLTDEDAAATEMDDMGDMLDGLLGE